MRFFSLKKQTVTLSALLVMLLWACNSPTSQCRQVGDAIRQLQTARAVFNTDIESAQLKISSAQSIADTQAAATDYIVAIRSFDQEIDAALKTLSAAETEDPQLNEYRESYILMLNGAKTAYGSASDAMQLVLDAEDEEALRSVFSTHQTKNNRAYDDILVQDARESALVDQIGRYCSQAS